MSVVVAALFALLLFAALADKSVVSVHNYRIRAGLEYLQPASVLTCTIDDFLAIGWTEQDYIWYQHAALTFGEVAALMALYDGHTDYLSEIIFL